MNFNYSNLFPLYGSWEDFMKTIENADPLPKEQLEGFLDYIAEECKKDFFDPRIPAGALLYMEKSGFTRTDVKGIIHANALAALNLVYTNCRLNRTYDSKAYIGGPPFPPPDKSSQVTGPMAGVP